MNIDLLRTLLTYDHQNGILYWLPRPIEMFPAERWQKRWNTRYAGKPALNSVGPRDTRIGAIFGKTVQAHVVAWAIFYGAWPDDEIDHRDHDPSNNRIRNLRRATRHGNCRNKSASGRSKYLGVSFHKASNKWVAQIQMNGRKKHIGLYDSEVDAAKAYDDRAKNAFGDFANLNFKEAA